MPSSHFVESSFWAIAPKIKVKGEISLRSREQVAEPKRSFWRHRFIIISGRSAACCLHFCRPSENRGFWRQTARADELHQSSYIKKEELRDTISGSEREWRNSWRREMINDWEITCEEDRKLDKNAGKLNGEGEWNGTGKAWECRQRSQELCLESWKTDRRRTTDHKHFRPLAKENRTSCSLLDHKKSPIFQVLRRPIEVTLWLRTLGVIILHHQVDTEYKKLLFLFQGMGKKRSSWTNLIDADVTAKVHNYNMQQHHRMVRPYMRKCLNSAESHKCTLCQIMLQFVHKNCTAFASLICQLQQAPPPAVASRTSSYSTDIGVVSDIFHQYMVCFVCLSV